MRPSVAVRTGRPRPRLPFRLSLAGWVAVLMVCPPTGSRRASPEVVQKDGVRFDAATWLDLPAVAKAVSVPVTWDPKFNSSRLFVAHVDLPTEVFLRQVAVVCGAELRRIEDGWHLGVRRRAPYPRAVYVKMQAELLQRFGSLHRESVWPAGLCDPTTQAAVRESRVVSLTALPEKLRPALESLRVKLSGSPAPAEQEAMWVAEYRFLWIRPDQVDRLRDFVESIAQGQRPAGLPGQVNTQYSLSFG